MWWSWCPMTFHQDFMYVFNTWSENDPKSCGSILHLLKRHRGNSHFDGSYTCAWSFFDWTERQHLKELKKDLMFPTWDSCRNICHSWMSGNQMRTKKFTSWQVWQNYWEALTRLLEDMLKWQTHWENIPVRIMDMWKDSQNIAPYLGV